MNWDRYFTGQMNSMYSCVAVDAAKMGALRESARDVAYLYETRAWFVRNGGGEATATLFTARAITELIVDGWMKLATWDSEGSPLPIDASDENLLSIVEELDKTGPTYFLVPTEKGREWVVRYDALLHELHTI